MISINNPYNNTTIVDISICAVQPKKPYKLVLTRNINKCRIVKSIEKNLISESLDLNSWK